MHFYSHPTHPKLDEPLGVYTIPSSWRSLGLHFIYIKGTSKHIMMFSAVDSYPLISACVMCPGAPWPHVLGRYTYNLGLQYGFL